MLQGFSKKCRLRTKAEYQRVFTRRKRLFGRFCVLYYQRNELGCPRLGIIVSKHNVRHAVLRNRLKRQVRELFRLIQKDLPAVDIVIIAKSGAGQASKRELQQCLKELMKQLVRQCKASLSD